MSRHFDEAAKGWDSEPRRVALMKAIGEAILREAKPVSDMDVLDYGCGTGLIGLFLLPHVRSVTGADNSPGMLQVLGDKIAGEGLENMKAIQLDLERDPVPDARCFLPHCLDPPLHSPALHRSSGIGKNKRVQIQ